MFNDINIGPFTLHMYGLMIAVGFLAALFLSEYWAKKKGLDGDILYGILVCAIVGGIVGCKLLYYIVELPQIIKDPSILLDFKNGFVVYGGIIGGVLASMLYIKKIKKTAFLPYLDIVMPGVAVGQGFGRIGCFFAGCCYGARTESAFSIVFKHSDYAPNNVKLIPTQLISSAGDFVIAAVLYFYLSRKHADGRVGALYFILYGIGRFAIEFLRDDYRGSIGVFSTSQIISLAVVVLGAVLFVRTGKR